MCQSVLKDLLNRWTVKEIHYIVVYVLGKIIIILGEGTTTLRRETRKNIFELQLDGTTALYDLPNLTSCKGAETFSF